ncbi:MAG TPA: FAD-dependent oxidoreductase [bacterium]|nr:FAD-dependent oxidoreductase [bacterium]
MTETERHVAVVGAGPAGLAATGEVQAAGARVLLIEERPVLGGRAVLVPGARGLTEGLMRNLGTAEVWRSSPVWAIAGRALGVLRAQRVDTVAALAVVLATGAPEVMTPFPGWTLRGVLTLEAGWDAVRAGRVTAESGPAVVVARGEHAALATRLAERGIAVTLVAADRPNGVPAAIPVTTGALTEARGDGAVEEAVLDDGAALPCRLLCVESPRVPAIELARLAGSPCVYQPLLGGFVPRYDPMLALHGPTPALFVAGDAAGVDTPRAAAESGRLAARAALRLLGLLEDPDAKIAEARARLAAASAPLRHAAREALMLGVVPDETIEAWTPRPDTIMCACEGVRLDALRDAAVSGAVAPDALAALTGCGLGECRWRRCGGPVVRWLSEFSQTPAGRIPLPALWPPLRPLPLGALLPSDADSGDGHA